MSSLNRKPPMNWIECPVVNVVPGKLSGAPVIIHSRVRPDDLVANRKEGAEWLAENYALPLDIVRAVLAYHDRKACVSRSASPERAAFARRLSDRQ